VTARNTRKYPRIPARFTVEWRLGEKTSRARAAVLGGGGIFLELTDPPPADAEVSLRFRPARHLPFIEAKARFLYHLPGQGVAFEFTEISSKHRELLLRLIEHKKGNRRQFPRVRLATQVQSEHTMLLTYSRDVSVGGMFIETKTPLPAESVLSVRFNLDPDGPIIVAKGFVTYLVKGFGMGMHFIEISPEDRDRIAAYVSRNMALVLPRKESRPDQ
jgi:c-di-GMP-binding flagellar brake protein YcgR